MIFFYKKLLTFFDLKTGSGKTFTITGGPEKYDDRGIIPRSISYFFELFSRVNYFYFDSFYG